MMPPEPSWWRRAMFSPLELAGVVVVSAVLVVVLWYGVVR